MQLTVVGSADAFNSTGRFHSCYLLHDAGRAPIMIDFGATALAALKTVGRDPRELGALVFTHLHGDHAGGWPFLMIDFMFNKVRAAPLPIIGPVGTAARLDAFLHAAYRDVANFERGFEIDIREISPGDEIDVLGARVHAFAADHMDPPDVPLCLRITGQDGKIVSFSGDTRMCDGLFAAADGADLLIAECTAMRQPAGRHCTWEEWQVALPTTKARRVVLTHLNDEMRAACPDLVHPTGGDLRFAEDGMEITI